MLLSAILAFVDLTAVFQLEDFYRAAPGNGKLSMMHL